MDLNVSIVNQTPGDQEFVVYQQNVDSKVENYLSAAWAYAYLANGGAHWDFVLPSAVEVSGIEDAPSVGTLTTNLLPAHAADAFKLFENADDGAFEIAKTGTGDPNAITIRNDATGPRWAAINKIGRPLFTALVAAEHSVALAVAPTLYIALSSNLRQGDLFASIDVTQSWAFPYEGYSSLRVVASQDERTKNYLLTGMLGA